MKFILVEIKNRDTFVLYDTVNKGVCCCDLNALHQLVYDYKFEVVGFDTVANKIVACCLNGTPRKVKTRSMCDDNIKRSASLISKGLPADKFPRSDRQQSVLHSRVVKTDSGDVTVTEGDILEFRMSDNQKFVGLVVYVPAIHSVSALSPNLFIFVDGFLDALYSKYKSIQPCKVSDIQKTYLHKVFNIFQQLAVLDVKRVAERSSMQRLIAEKQAELQQLNVSYAKSQGFLVADQMKAILHEYLKDKLCFNIDGISACLPVGNLKSASSGVFTSSFSYDSLSSLWTLALTTSVYIYAHEYDMIDTPYFDESESSADGDGIEVVPADTSLWDVALADISGSFKTSFKRGKTSCSVGCTNKGYLINYRKSFSFKSSYAVGPAVFRAFLDTVQ